MISKIRFLDSVVCSDVSSIAGNMIIKERVSMTKILEEQNEINPAWHEFVAAHALHRF